MPVIETTLASVNGKSLPCQEIIYRETAIRPEKLTIRRNCIDKMM